MNDQILSALIPSAEVAARDSIAATLERFGKGALRFAAERRTRIHVLRNGEKYLAASPELAKLSIDVDCWPSPPAGLFVVQERTVYLRSLSPMTISHEFGHALDCALGGGIYFSGVDLQVRDCFASARSFITPYAASGIDEYFAESMRAYVGACNDPASAWPAATPERLRSIDGAIYDTIARIFQRFDSA